MLVSGLAVSGGGASTVGRMVLVLFCPSESATTYSMAGAVPTNVGSGSKVTRPVVGLTVYVPSAVVRVVPVHDAAAVPVAQMRTVVGSSVVPLPAESFASGSITWLVSHASVLVSGLRVGAGGTIGVSTPVALLASESVTWYVMGVAVPVKPATGVNVTLPTSAEAAVVFTVHVPCAVVSVVRVHGTVVPFCGGVVVGSQSRVSALSDALKDAPLPGVAAADEPATSYGANTALVPAAIVWVRVGAEIRVVYSPSTSVTWLTATVRLVASAVVVAADTR